MSQALDWSRGCCPGAPRVAWRVATPALGRRPSRRRALLLPSPAFRSARAPRGQTARGGGEGDDGISQRGGSGFPATRQSVSVYGVKGEMEKAGRRRLASAAPPLGRLRRRESGADKGGLGGQPGLEVPRSLVRSGRDDAPRSGIGRPGSSFRCRRTSPSPRARLRGGWATGGAPSRLGAAAAALRPPGNPPFGDFWVSLWWQPSREPRRSSAGAPGRGVNSRAPGGGGVPAGRATALPRFSRVAAAAGTAGKHLAQGSHGVQTPTPPPSSAFPDP